MELSATGSDFASIFRYMTLPAAILEPTLDAAGVMVDLAFKEVNRAFERDYLIPSEQRSLMQLMTREGLDGSLFLASVSALRPGETKRVGVEIKSARNCFVCVTTKLDSGNLVVVIESVCATGSSNGAAVEESLEVPVDAGGTPIRIVINPMDGTVIDASGEAVEFYGYSRNELRGMPIRDLIVSYDKTETQGRGQGDDRAIVLARHRLANGTIIEAFSWSFVSRWAGKPAIFTLVDAPAKELSAQVVRVPRRKDRLGQPIDPGVFDSFALCHSDIPFLDELLCALIPHGVLVNCKKGTRYLEYGEISRRVGFILKGFFRKYTITPEGKDFTLDFYRTGRIIDSYANIKYGRKSISAFEARSDCLVYVVDLESIKALSYADHRWYRLFYYNLADRLLRQDERDSSILHEDALTKYNRFLAHNSDILPFLKSYHVASYLGIASETLSRIRKMGAPLVDCR